MLFSTFWAIDNDISVLYADLASVGDLSIETTDSSPLWQDADRPLFGDGTLQKLGFTDLDQHARAVYPNWRQSCVVLDRLAVLDMRSVIGSGDFVDAGFTKAQHSSCPREDLLVADREIGVLTLEALIHAEHVEVEVVLQRDKLRRALRISNGAIAQEEGNTDDVEDVKSHAYSPGLRFWFATIYTAIYGQ